MLRAACSSAWAAVATGLAHEFRLADAILFRYVPAGFTAVRGVAGIHVDADASSVFRFGAQYRQELPPPRITNASVQSGLRRRHRWAGTGREFRVVHGFGPPLHSWRSEGPPPRSSRRTATRSRALLWWKSRRWLAILRCRAATVCARLRAVLRAALLAGQPLLCGRQPDAARTYETNADFTLGSPSDVDIKLVMPTSIPTRRPVAGSGVGRHVVARQDQHPATTLAADLDRLNPSQHLPMRADRDLADALQVDPRLSPGASGRRHRL